MGMLRVFLAICVISAHTGSGYNLGVGGRQAVILFYVISGFYMALVLSQKYIGSNSVNKFYAARYTRLWFPYIPVLLLSLAILLYVGSLSNLSSVYSGAPPWLALLAIISNIFIVGQDLFWLISFTPDDVHFLPFGESGHNGKRLMLNGPLFSVGIELYFYLLAPFFVRSLKGASFLLIVGAVWLIITSQLGFHRHIGLQYHAAPSAFLYFGFGACVYHLCQSQGAVKDVYCLLLSVLLMVFSSSMVSGLLVVFLGLSIPQIFKLTKNNKIDGFVGEFSYLLYIIHTPLILLIKKEFGLGRGSDLFWFTLVFSVLVSLVLYFLVDRYVSAFRTKRFGSGH